MERFYERSYKDIPRQHSQNRADSYQKTGLKRGFDISFQIDGKNYPQIHDILFMLNKNDPQGSYPKIRKTILSLKIGKFRY